MARSTGSHALPVGWDEPARFGYFLGFAGIHRSSAGISCLGINISLPCHKILQALQKMEGLFL